MTPPGAIANVCFGSEADYGVSTAKSLFRARLSFPRPQLDQAQVLTRIQNNALLLILTT